ncbi:TetR/AcrR family transcriptional regulator C-terminal domain-containing protein [Microtetraspora sp. AC03309]|uniref:TetR/AcrR family transcriptional regulator n=1 Tax=Microtetraspora sp. AC03309 TaxID=2779376 RepID=UPI001E5A05C1|nr:TetR/AcrR family transcriptional regulator [Microtetraspora sp. AC03309]MCC5576223.1 TetR/AcrR family transcriptional regulator C-terminal domain-containing protein [Microtetraspora sp. AC03309]
MAELPPVVARMWGREPASRRGPRPRLDLETITTAAIEIADAEGLAGVSMSSVAAQVGVAPMALYRYVGSKDELLTAMADSAVPPPPERGTLTWRDYLATWTRANRDFLLSRPWLLSVQALTPPMGPRRLYWLDRALDALGDTTLEDGEKFNAATALTGYALTDATLVHTMNAAGQKPDATGITGAADYGEVLAEVLDPQTYPALSAMMRSGLLRESEGWTEDADFLFGLNLLLDGIEALIARRASQPGG